MIDGKVAHELQLQSQFGAFWDSTLDRRSGAVDGLIFRIRSRPQRLRDGGGAHADLPS
jgi:hypothetical protein